MKKNEIKGLSAFELLEGLDDDMILSASLPEAVPATPPTTGEKITAFFARMGKGGMAAAITGIVVAAAVLLGIALARPFEVIDPPDTDPSQGIHGTQPHESGNLPDTNNGIVAPPLTQNPEQEKGEVAVVSDGITVYPKGYMVWLSQQYRDENGEMTGEEADGAGASWRLGEIKDEIPKMRTAGNDFSLCLPEHMSLRNVRAFEIVEIQNDHFEEVALGIDGTSHDPMMNIAALRDGNYIVVLDIYSEISYSEDEYVKGLDEYAFWLTVDSNMDITYPVRMLIDGKTHYLEGNDGINSGYALAGMTASIPTAVMTRETEWDVYLSPQGTLQSVTAYDGSFRLMMTEPDLEPLVSLPAWAEGDYYLVFTVSFPFEGGSMTLEYPFHIKLSEDTEKETYPNDDGETPEPPRLTVGTGFGSLHFGNTSHSSEYHEGYMLWTEQWYDGGMVSGDGFGATGQLSDISAGLPVLRHYAGEEPHLRVIEDKDTLTRIYIYYEDHSFYADAKDASVLSTLPEGSYIIVLRVETQGDYIDEADAYERTCTEYAFILEVVEEYAGIPGVPETTPRVIVSGGGQSAVFETEEDGVLMWTEKAGQERKVITVPMWFEFADPQTIDRLPRMSLKPGDELTLTLDAAGDSLIGVTVYEFNKDTVAQGEDLSVISPTLFDKWLDEGVVFSGRVVLEVTSRTGEDEISCYEYVFFIEVAP
ncbi:MAG: hypothetical protein J6K29_10010 [Clostridia bacterium]|nr:hypothetical protein [Clostridia bacterium]